MDSTEPTSPELTRLLCDARSGDREAIRAVSHFVYDALYALAKKQRQRLICATELAHEAYVRLFGGNGNWNDRHHFNRYAAKAIRSIVVDRARERERRTRLLPLERVPLDSLVTQMERRSGKMEDFDRVLNELAAVDEKAALLVELRFFAGLKEAEAAQSAEVPLRTAQRKLAMARAWLRATITDGS